MSEGASKYWYWFPCILFPALAGGMAWGIRGQYGHETGAMMAGLLVSGTLVFLLGAKLPLRDAARARRRTSTAVASRPPISGSGSLPRSSQIPAITAPAEAMKSGTNRISRSRSSASRSGSARTLFAAPQIAHARIRDTAR